MCAKKKAASSKAWKLAGEPIYSAPVSAAEREQIEDEFLVYKNLRGRESRGMPGVTPAEARVHESAVQAVAGFLCQHYAGRFQRSTIIKVVSATAAVPANLPVRAACHLDFLTGAALWLLDYLGRAFEIYDRLKPAAPELPDVMEELARTHSPLQKADRRSELPEIFFLLLAPELICHPLSKMQEELHSRKAAELLAGYGVDDPYGLCAAYLLLEREGDALANLNALTAIVMICAERHLPWAQDDFGARAGLFQDGAPDYRLRYECSDLPDEDGEEPLELEWRLSETQLFFLATGVALPRRRVPSESLVRWFMRQGVEEHRARELAWAAFIAYYTDGGEHGWRDIDLFGGDGEEEEPPADGPEEPGEVPVGPPPDSGPDPQTEALTRKVKELQGALHDAERAAGRLKEQLREAQRCGEADRAELAQLRETLYQLRAGEEESDEASGPLIELPWQVRRRVVVFGGHDSWRKAIKPLLPGARFYDREVLPDLNAIRGADVVWLQVNALSHKYYYRIIDAARKNDIPVRYFGSASAKKCAVQLALDELAAERRVEV